MSLANQLEKGNPVITVQDAVRDSVHGLTAAEAAVDLLICHGKTIYDGAPPIKDQKSDDGLGITSDQSGRSSRRVWCVVKRRAHRRADSGAVYDADGKLTGFAQLTSLYPWPEEPSFNVMFGALGR